MAAFLKARAHSMRSILTASVVVAVGLVRSAFGAEPNPVALEKIERVIVKQPQYVSDRPLYGLVVFGPEAKTKAWAVFDQSPDSKKYDVLYFDRNANGDLTEAGERIEGQPEAGSNRFVFDLGSFTDPATGETHSNFKFDIQGSDGPVEHPLLVGVELKWNGEHRVASGYGTQFAGFSNSSPKWNFAENTQTAPIFWFGGSAPLTFNGYFMKPLNIDRAQIISVTLGNPGVGQYSFSTVLSDFLPKNVPVQFSLQYTGTDGKQMEIKQDSRKRCSGILHSAFMRIPADARPGRATVRCSLPAESGFACVPVEFPVELVRPAAETTDDDDPAPYDEIADVSQQIASALATAKADNKTVLLQFGGNWCLWCSELHNLFGSEKEIHEQLNQSYIEVLIDVNEQNRAVDEQYGTPSKLGLPVIVVLDSDGKLLTMQNTSEWEDGELHHSRAKVLAFLKQWAPKK
jgi:hypothetical protein